MLRAALLLKCQRPFPTVGVVALLQLWVVASEAVLLCMVASIHARQVLDVRVGSLIQ